MAKKNEIITEQKPSIVYLVRKNELTAETSNTAPWLEQGWEVVGEVPQDNA